MTHWLYISPHLDDAVLSCGGSIAARVASGDRITVATVFTAASESAGCLYEQRREEDRSAAREMGFDTVHLGLLDAPFRSSAYRDFASIVYSDPSSGEASAVTGRVAGELRSLVARLGPERLAVPLGVGGHIDHKITFRASASIRDSIPAAYYEERPYGFVPGAVACRWIELGGKPANSSPLYPNPRRLSQGWERLPFLENYMANDADPARCMERLQDAERSLTEAQRTATSWSWQDGVYSRSCRRLVGEAADALVGGIAAYKSQLRDLFVSPAAPGTAGGLEASVRRVYEHHARAPVAGAGHWHEGEWVRNER